MNAKCKGTVREHRSKRPLEALGYTVFRIAGSHGLFDLIEISATAVALVQCKTWDLPYGVEREALRPSRLRRIVAS